MDLILLTMTKLKELINKLKSLFSFVDENYLPDVSDDGKSGIFDFFDFF